MKIIRPDYIFSYWVFTWYILYILQLVQNSPKFALLLGIIENTLAMFTMVYMNTKVRYTVFFIIINLFLKVAPLLSIINDKITQKDIYTTIMIFVIYNIWLFLNGTNFVTIYYLITSKNYKSILMYLFDKYL